MSSINLSLLPHREAIARFVRSLEADLPLNLQDLSVEEWLRAFSEHFTAEDFQYGLALATPQPRPSWYRVPLPIEDNCVARGPEAALALLLEQCAHQGAIPQAIHWRPQGEIRVTHEDGVLIAQPVTFETVDPTGRHRVEKTLQQLHTRYEEEDVERRITRLGFEFTEPIEADVEVEAVPSEGALIMRTPASLAQELRGVLQRLNLQLPLSRCQELLAHLFGARNWQTLIANAPEATYQNPPARLENWFSAEIELYPTLADAVWTFTQRVRAHLTKGYHTTHLSMQLEAPYRGLRIPRANLSYEGVHDSLAEVYFRAEGLWEMQAEPLHQACAARLLASNCTAEAMALEFGPRAGLRSSRPEDERRLTANVGGWRIQVRPHHAGVLGVRDPGGTERLFWISGMRLYRSLANELWLEGHDTHRVFHRVFLPTLTEEELTSLRELLTPVLRDGAIHDLTQPEQPEPDEDDEPDHGFTDLEFDLPDVVAALPKDTAGERINGLPGRYLTYTVAEERLHFIRAILPIPVRGFREHWGVFVWVEVDPEDQLRFAHQETQPLKEGQTMAGGLANNLLGGQSDLGSPVLLHFVEGVPLITQAGIHGDPINSALRQGLSAREVGELERLHAS